MKLACMGPHGSERACDRAPLFATWCACPFSGELTLASSLFFWCEDCIAGELTADPGAELFAVEHVAGELRLRAIARPLDGAS